LYKHGPQFITVKQPKTHSNKIEADEASYLYTEISQLPASGTGLHTAIDIYKDEVIAVFKGELITDRQAFLRAQKGKDKYFIALPNGSILDSMKVKCFAKYANDAVGYSNSGFKNNGRIELDESGNVCIVAKRKIKTGEEIFCGYGKRYWAKHSNN
jgi:hypothetical protein